MLSLYTWYIYIGDGQHERSSERFSRRETEVSVDYLVCVIIVNLLPSLVLIDDEKKVVICSTDRSVSFDANFFSR